MPFFQTRTALLNSRRLPGRQPDAGFRVGATPGRFSGLSRRLRAVLPAIAAAFLVSLSSIASAAETEDADPGALQIAQGLQGGQNGAIYSRSGNARKGRPISCYDFNSYIRCENDQVYVRPGQAGAAIIVEPTPWKPSRLSEATRDAFDRILENSLRDAKNYCRQLRPGSIGEKTACIRRQLDRFVLVTRDEDLINYYEAEFKNKVDY